MSAADEIKSRLDIVDIIGEVVQLRKSGRSYSGFCPFHANTKTPAFHVFPDTQTWHCFGACAEGGDLFSFVMKRENLGFREALEVLAPRAGVTLEKPAAVNKEREARSDRLLNLLDAAADYFHQLFLYAPQGEHARQYVAGRAYDDRTVAHFKIGFALNAWDGLKTHFAGQGYTLEELLAVGLLTANADKGTVYDRFRNRLVIPIRNLNGRVVGFGARTLEKDGVPKYLNSPQGELFDKGRLLFGLDTAKRDIREARQVVIVEGYMDVIRAWQAGFNNVVAQMGTSLTSDQLRLLKRYTKRFVLALDADAAGANATLRSLDVARETLDREADFSFDARGLVRQEGRLQADIRVVSMPDGQDPDDVIRENPGRWAQLLEQAQPVVAYVIDVLTAGLDLNDARVKAEVADRILPLIADIAEPVVRDHYRQELGKRLRIDERALRQAQARQAGSGQRATVAVRGKQQARPVPIRAARSGQSARGAGISTRLREDDLLRHLFNSPHLLHQVDQRLNDVNEPPVRAADFENSEDKVLLHHLRVQIERGTMDLIEEPLEQSLQERAEFFQKDPPTIPPEELPYLPDKLAKAVLDCRLEKVKVIRRLAYGLLGDVEQVDERAEVFLQLQQQNERERQINQAKHGLSATGQRAG